MTESRPVPQFYNQTLLTKKIKYNSTPYNRKIQPPRPCKSISPKQPLFNNRLSNDSSNNSYRAQAVSFKENTANQSMLSKHYDEHCDEPYFQQCFEVFSTLGSGFFGDVFKVRSKEDGRFYAVKKSRNRFKSRSDREKKLQEVAKHEHLPEHPNLVKFYKAWEEEQRLYIQIELCECSLQMFADLNHDIPESVVWNFLIDMLQAVEHLHSHQYLHLDIKPENIFISKDGLYKLGDFGLVFDLSKKSVFDPLEGDPKCLAKETIQGIFTEAADIFSLGITTLELACDLDLPTGGETWHILRNNNIPESCFKNISPELKYLIKKMMHSDYKTRPTATELLNYPIIKKLRRKREFRNKLYSTYHSTIDYLISFFVFLLTILGIFKLTDYVKRTFSNSDNISTPIFKKDSSISQLNMQSPILNAYSAKKDRTFNVNDHTEQMVTSLDSSFNLGLPNRNLINVNNLYQHNLNNKLQDSTINSSANPNQSINNNQNQANNSDITPPMYSFNHYIRNNADLQSTTHRSLRKRNTATNINNNSFYSNSTTLNLSNGCDTPFRGIKKDDSSTNNCNNNLKQVLDDSPPSIYFKNSFNQSSRLDFSEDEDDDLEDHSKLNLSLHNQTVGQKNLLKIFESIDD